MNEIKKISSSLEETLKDSDLQSVTIDLAETLTDTLIQDGVLKDIPVIGTVFGLSKFAISLNERLFVKKLIYFISELKEVEKSKRNKLISEIDNSEKEQIKVGEKLLYIIDKAEDHLTAKYIAVVFKAFLNEEISYSDFLRCSTIIQKLLIQDLELFIDSDITSIGTKITQYDKGLSDFHSSLIISGICVSQNDSISVRDQDDYKLSDRYIVDGGDLIVYLTEIGYTLKKVLKESIRLK
ncbi:MAG: hypothetical protein GXX85_17880 [Ignavibacteria bacterium]|nr:hypothetical protein [Ignavibacteria bacterium]